MTFEKVTRTRGGTRDSRPGVPVSAAVRLRGIKRRLTPSIIFKDPIAEELFGKECLEAGGYMTLMVGKDKSIGKIRITPGTPDDHNVRLRRPSPQAGEYLIETMLIPFQGKEQIKRKPAVYFGGKGTPLVIELPWSLTEEVKEEGDL